MIDFLKIGMQYAQVLSNSPTEYERFTNKKFVGDCCKFLK